MERFISGEKDRFIFCLDVFLATNIPTYFLNNPGIHRINKVIKHMQNDHFQLEYSDIGIFCSLIRNMKVVIL